MRRAPSADIFRAVIRFDSVSKNHGRQILFMEASASVNRGEKVGLVGPNGSGKTTLFRLLVGEEQPDGGQVVVDRGIRTGYFSQDVGDMAGRTVLAETMAGAGEVSVVGAELPSFSHIATRPKSTGGFPPACARARRARSPASLRC